MRVRLRWPKLCDRSLRSFIAIRRSTPSRVVGMIRSVHPFPARMGPDLAIERLKRITKPSIVLDPMAGSGTVLRHASELGHHALGRDLDPLAILMAKVWTTPVDQHSVERKHAK